MGIKSKIRLILIVVLGLMYFTCRCKKELPYTFDQPITDIDGNVYKTIKIGTQVWMAENLKTTKYSDGTPIPYISTVGAWDSLTSTNKAYCWYDDIFIKDTYGALYNWVAAMNGEESSNSKPSNVQGVCPIGWHLPSLAEWYDLILYLDIDAEFSGYLRMSTIAGGKMKEKGPSHWQYPNISATNESGFTALPGGLRIYDGYQKNIKQFGYWWSSTEAEPGKMWMVLLSFNSGSADKSSSSYDTGISVRCLKNN